jgi:hypothetical protein
VQLKLGLDDDQLMLRQSIAAACRPKGEERLGHFSMDLWGRVAATGAFALISDEGGGSPSDMVAAFEALGTAAVCGPVTPTVFAMRTLSPGRLASIADGEELIGLQVGDLAAWVPPARSCIEWSADGWWLCEVEPGGPAVGTMAGEPWSRTRSRRLDRFADVEPALAAADLAAAAYLVGAGLHLLGLSVEHANGRRQFGREIGSFQAIAHTLARREAELTSAQQLIRLTAVELQDEKHDGSAAPAAAAASIADKAALAMAFSAHQTFGALGFTTEADIGTYASQIRQVSLLRLGRVRQTSAKRPHGPDGSPTSGVT